MRKDMITLVLCLKSIVSYTITSEIQRWLCIDTHPLGYQVFDRLVEVDGKSGSKMDLCDRLSDQKETRSCAVCRVRLWPPGDLGDASFSHDHT